MAPKRPRDNFFVTEETPKRAKKDPRSGGKKPSSKFRPTTITTTDAQKTRPGVERTHKIRPEHLPDGPWKRKLLRERSQRNSRQKSARTYSKVRREYERERAQQEAAKAKAKAAQVIVPAQPLPEEARRGQHLRDVKGKHAGSSSGDEEFETAEEEVGEEDEDGLLPGRRNAFESPRKGSSKTGTGRGEPDSSTPELEAQVEGEEKSDAESSTLSSAQPPTTSPQKPRSKPPQSKPTKTPGPEPSPQPQQNAPNEPPENDPSLHPSRRKLLSRTENSFLSRAAQKAAHRQETLEQRRREREEREEERQQAIADRQRIRRLMRKAKEPGADGKRKLGRESRVLLEQVKRMMVVEKRKERKQKKRKEKNNG